MIKKDSITNLPLHKNITLLYNEISKYKINFVDVTITLYMFIRSYD
ncbi:hypothetical protein BN191_140002 [Clostridioides difficile T61]|nr:hypothetical protein BN169_160002 [Clostridioides difficile E16]CCL93988.1 hypothetical protein BN191_140002 [Clostridioides difficile T61]